MSYLLKGEQNTKANRLLEFTVKERGGEGVEATAPSDGQGPLQPQGITRQTAVRLTVGHRPKIGLGVVLVILEDDRDIQALGHLDHAFPATQVFLQGMNVGIVI